MLFLFCCIVMGDLHTILISYGFSDKEALVYLTGIQLWSAPVSVIARRSGLKRANTYDILEWLRKRQVVSVLMREGTKYFTMSSPENLLKKLKRQYEKFQSSLPEFLTLANSAVYKAKIEYYEWRNGIKKIYNDQLLHENSEIRIFLSVSSFPRKLIDELLKDHIPLRIKKWIYAKVIVATAKDGDTEYRDIEGEGVHKSTLVINDDIELDAQIYIYSNNKISIMVTHDSELFGVIITSEKIHKTCLSLFNFIWKHHGGKELDQQRKR